MLLYNKPSFLILFILFKKYKNIIYFKFFYIKLNKIYKLDFMKNIYLKI